VSPTSLSARKGGERGTGGRSKPVAEGPILRKTKDRGNKRPTQKQPYACCALRIHLKKNNFFVNITNLKGRTLARFSTGIFETKSNARAKKNMIKYIKLILYHACSFVKTNFQTTRVYIKSDRPNLRLYFKILSFYFISPSKNQSYPFIQKG
jgi:hypothetical protein